jgi:transcriptional regulator with XRE-family HTH domain
MGDDSPPSSIRQILSRNLRFLRTKAGLSQEQLADLSELHRTYIGSVERGERNISVDNLERIAGAFKITVADLLTERDA